MNKVLEIARLSLELLEIEKEKTILDSIFQRKTGKGSIKSNI